MIQQQRATRPDNLSPSRPVTFSIKQAGTPVRQQLTAPFILSYNYCSVSQDCLGLEDKCFGEIALYCEFSDAGLLGFQVKGCCGGSASFSGQLIKTRCQKWLVSIYPG